MCVHAAPTKGGFAVPRSFRFFPWSLKRDRVRRLKTGVVWDTQGAGRPPKPQTNTTPHPPRPQPLSVFCARSPPPLNHGVVGSHLLGLAAQVVVVRQVDDQDDHPADQQQQGGVGQDPELQ